MNPVNVSGVITITTDFGHKGPFAAIMKGVILQRFPDARIIDLAHDIPAHWPPEAGFWISRSYRYFPNGSVHIAIVDPGVGTEREIILAEYDGHVFVAPDNGLLDLLLAMDSCVVYQLDADKLADIGIQAPSATFHGRDIFAPVAAEIAAGRLQAADIANVTDQWTPGWIEEPQVSEKQVSGVVVTIDAFGNLICNIERHHVEALQNPVVQIAGNAFEMATTYGRVQPGSYLALINSFDVLEIARSEGNAAEGLGSDRGAPVIVSERPS
jgi:S-adenosylmethionine hydrolase